MSELNEIFKKAVEKIDGKEAILFCTRCEKPCKEVDFDKRCNDCNK